MDQKKQELGDADEKKQQTIVAKQQKLEQAEKSGMIMCCFGSRDVVITVLVFI